jgi:hypothetical protein
MTAAAFAFIKIFISSVAMLSDDEKPFLMLAICVALGASLTVVFWQLEQARDRWRQSRDRPDVAPSVIR